MAITSIPKTNMSVSFAMVSAIPPDYNAYFNSLEEAKAAAAIAKPPGSTESIYYYCQVLHVLTETSADIYIIQPDNTLRYIGSETGESDKSFVFTQSVAAAKWEIQHNLDKYPSVSIVDSAGTEVVGDVQYIDKNNIVILFTAPFSGKAYMN
jgi:hypothetical protein|nr:MAG TPA: hypothetical protein [Caudoviricetes sp.]